MDLPMQFVRMASAATTLSDELLRGTANAVHEFCRWVSDPSLPDSTAAPIITEAVHHVATIMEHAEKQTGKPLSCCAMEELRTALSNLQSFLVDDETESTKGSFPASNSETNDRESEEQHHSAHRAALHLRLIVGTLFLVVVGCTIGIMAIGIHELHNQRHERRRNDVSNLLAAAINALDALIPSLHEFGVDVRYSGVAIAGSLLEELSSARAVQGSSQTIFFTPQNSLFEFRAGTQNFAQNGRVTAVTTARTYGLLCRQNLTRQYKPLNDASPTTSVVIPALTPGKCANDAGARGPFATVTPPTKMFTRYVETYRRNGASSASYYHQTYGTSIIVTLDEDELQNLMVPSNLVFGLYNPFSGSPGDWKGYATRWLSILLVGVLCVLLAGGELLTLSSTKPRSFWMSVLFGLFIGGSLVVVKAVVQDSLSEATKEFQTISARIMGRCLAAALTSSTLLQYEATQAFVALVVNGVLHDNAFFIYNDPNANNGQQVQPPRMKPIAVAIDAYSFNNYRIIQNIGYAGGYSYASFFDVTNDRHVVFVERENYRIHLSSTVWIAVGAGVASFMFVYAYLRLSPLNRLAAAGRGSPLLQHYVAPQRLRFLLYVLILVAVVAAMVALNVFGTTLINSATARQSGETLQLVGATNRARSVVDSCIGSCGLPSTITTQVFNLVDGAPALVYSYVPYPVPVGEWESHYYGAQLALSKLPTVLEGMMSFSTPLVNRTSGYIEPRYLQHRMLASVDVNDTSGFVMERLKSSTHSSTYSFVSQSIGLCLALGAVCIGVCVLEWLYTRLGHLQRERKSLLSSYVMMVVVVLLVSSMLLVSAAIMKYEMRRALEDFAKQELSLAVRAGNTRLEGVSMEGYSAGWSHDEIVENVTKAVIDMSTTLRAGISFVARWRVLEEFPVRGSGTYHIRGGESTYNQVVRLPQDAGTTIAVCTTELGDELSATSTEKKLSCYVEIATSGSGSIVDTNPRMFLLVWRHYSDVVDTPAEQQWEKLMKVAGAACGVMLMGLWLVLWYVMRAVHPSSYPIFAKEEVLAVRTTHDQCLPRRRRLLWVCCLSACLLCVLGYYTTSMSMFVDDLLFVDDLSLPYETQDFFADKVKDEAVASIYSYILFPSAPVTLDYLSDVAVSVVDDTSAYSFAVAENRESYAATIDLIVSNLTAATLISATAEADLIALGFDSYDSYVADLYRAYVARQDSIASLVETLYGSVKIFLSYGDTGNFHTKNVPPVLQACELLMDSIHKLFILDHMAVASFLVFTTGTQSNVHWPLGDEAEAEAMIEKTREAMGYFQDRINTIIIELRETASELMGSSPVYPVMSMTATKVSEELPLAVAIRNPTASFWYQQKLRCVEAKFKGNISLEARVGIQKMELLSTLATNVATLGTLSAKDLSYRKEVELIDYIRRGEDVSRMQAMLAWERVAVVEGSRYKMFVCFCCTVSLLVVELLAFGLWYVAHRNAAIRQTAESALALLPPSESQSVHRFVNELGKSRATFVVRAGMITALIALVPISCAYWLSRELLHISMGAGDNKDAVALYATQEQIIFCESVQAFLRGSAYALVAEGSDMYINFISSIMQSAVQFSVAYQTATIVNANITASLQQFMTDMSAVMLAALVELQRYTSITTLGNMISTAEPQSAYARSVLQGMTATDDYSMLLSISISCPGPVKTLSDDLFEKAKSIAGDELVSTTTIFESYIDQLEELNAMSRASLSMWHATVTAAANGGSSVAATYWDFESLVGADALTPLSSSGVASAGAAVTAITTFYAPLLAVSATKDAVATLFTSTDEPTTDTGPISAYLNAAFVSTYLSSIMTPATFANTYAYNRGLTHDSRLISPSEPSLLSLLNGMVAISEYLITSGLSTPSYVYTIKPATTNKWIWSTVVEGAHVSTNVLTNFNYLQVAIQWCCVTAYWAVFAGMVAILVLGGALS